MELEIRGVWMGGTQLWAGPAEFGWVARGSGGARGVWVGGTAPAARSSGAGGSHGWVAGPRAAAQELGELGARGVWMGGRVPAVLMHVPGTYNIDGLSAGWVTACTHTC